MNKKSSQNIKSKISKINTQSNEFRDKIAALTYEESLKELDNILNHLQSENIPIDQMQEYYIKGNIYLEHCQNLLGLLKQEVEELNIKDIN